MQEQRIKQFPKIELHCHLDGSISERGLITILKESGQYSKEQWKSFQKKLKAPDHLYDLADYLSCFDYILPFLQTAFSLRIAAYELIRQAAMEAVLYIEVRFAPQLHCRENLSQMEAVKAVLKGLEWGERDFGVKSRCLLCMMRGKQQEVNQITLDCVKSLREYGVGGLDLAGNEAAYPPELYQELFEQARSTDIPFTIHAGECGSAANVRTAVAMGARRIGHGVAIAGDEDVMRLCREKGITLEMCPVSNLQTGAVKRLEEYPFEKIRQEQIAAAINTDNRTVSDTTLTKEWLVLSGQFPEIQEPVLKQTGLQSITAAFLPSSEKEKLRKEFLENIL